MYLVGSLISATVCALHGVATRNAQPPPHHNSSSGFLRFFNSKAACLPAEGRGSAGQDLRKDLSGGYFMSNDTCTSLNNVVSFTSSTLESS